MYSVVLATVLAASASAPDLGRRSWACHGCHGVCYGGCYGVGYGHCHGCGGCGGCWGCSGCYGGCGGCYGGCGGCGGCFGWSGCYGGCGGCGGCYGGSSCCGGYYSCGGGCGGWSCHGCSAVIEHAAPVISHAAPVISYPAPMAHGCVGVIHGSPINGTVIHGAPINGTIIHGAPVNGVIHGAPVNAAPSVIGDSMPAGHSSLKPASVLIKAATDVKVSVNGQATTRAKAEESFKTPELRVGRVYSYEVVAEAIRDGKPVKASKRVLVRAGERSEVDFGDIGEAAVVKDDIARVTVVMPEGGKLFVEGKSFGGKVAKQTFDTPKLTKGKTYYYNMEVKSADNATHVKRVSVEAGREVMVDFRTTDVAAR